jgi:hypothetical protein
MGTVNHITAAAEDVDIRVLRVAEGEPGNAADGTPQRIFSVVLSRCAGEELGIVAAAVPVPGSLHPTLSGYVARPPDIFCVGLRAKNSGAMLATATNFYNVRVRYEACSVPVRALEAGESPYGDTTNQGSPT